MANTSALPKGNRRRTKMGKQYKVVARIVSQKGPCSLGHKVGDEFVIGDYTPAGMCSWAFYTLFPFAAALQFGGVFPWESDPDKAVVACPDAENQTVFELRRIGRRRKPVSA
jgi:uncharacterized repeat protein (TIGR04076 family)